MDVLVPAAMKDAAVCDKRRELHPRSVEFRMQIALSSLELW